MSSLPVNLDSSPITNCPPTNDTENDIFISPPPDAAILEHFRAYRTTLEGRRLHFTGPDPQTGEVLTRTVDAASTSRYTPAGRTAMKRKLSRRLSRAAVPGVLLTLTIDPKRFSKCEAWATIWREYAAFRRRLWKHLKSHDRRHNPAYVAVLEQHKSGYPHLHVAYPGLRYLAPKDVINSAWHAGFAHISGGRTGRTTTLSPLAYVCKYVGKLTGWSDQGLAYLWHARARLYNLSRRLYTAAPQSKNSGWTLTTIDYTTDALRDLAHRLTLWRYLTRSPAPGHEA